MSLPTAIIVWSLVGWVHKNPVHILAQSMSIGWSNLCALVLKNSCQQFKFDAMSLDQNPLALASWAKQRLGSDIYSEDDHAKQGDNLETATELFAQITQAHVAWTTTGSPILQPLAQPPVRSQINLTRAKKQEVKCKLWGVSVWLSVQRVCYCSLSTPGKAGSCKLMTRSSQESWNWIMKLNHVWKL